MPVFRALIENNKTEHFQTIAIVFCDVFNIVDPVVCSLAIKQYEVYAKENSKTFTILFKFYCNKYKNNKECILDGCFKCHKRLAFK